MIKIPHHIRTLSGEVTIPGDKSISHRSIMFGALARGKSTVRNFLFGDDCMRTISVLKQLGVDIDVQKDKITIYGKGFEGLEEPAHFLDVGNSGTTIRLLLGILAGCPFHTCLIGDRSIAKRPMTRVTGPLREMGAHIDGRNDGEFTPLAVRGGRLQAITYTLPIASAQVKSAILLAGLRAEGETVLTEKERTRNHTENMIKQFGGRIETNDLTIRLPGQQILKGADVFVPGDISSAAFWLVAGAIVPHAKITLRNVGLNETRSGILEVMERMGAKMSISRQTATNYFEPIGNIEMQYSTLIGTVIDGAMIPRLIDEIPVIALLATQAEGTTVIKDAAELKVKETDRIDTVVKELKKLGADIEAREDGMVIRGKTILQGGCTVSSHGDHRIGMMLAIAGLICQQTVTLEDTTAIAISYPHFFNDLEKLVVHESS